MCHVAHCASAASALADEREGCATWHTPLFDLSRLRPRPRRAMHVRSVIAWDRSIITRPARAALLRVRGGGGAAGVVALGLADPDVAEADGVAVLVQLDRALGAAGLVVVAEVLVAGGAEELGLVVDQDAVVEDGGAGFAGDLAAFVPARAFEDDVVGLPLAGRARGVDHGRVLAVHRAGAAVGVGLVLVGVEDLDLVL